MAWMSLPSHIDSGLIFGLLGLWHILSTLRLYVLRPNQFKSRAWFPVPLPGPLRCIELWTLLVIVIIFISKQLSHATEDMASGVIRSEHLMRFQHVAFSLFYLLYIIVALIHEIPNALPLPDGALQATFGLGFLMELVIFHFGHHPGDNLESHVHMLMQLILGTLFLLMLLEIQFPRSALVAIARAVCLTFKGTWFFQIGLLINFPAVIPLGCVIPEEENFPQCGKPMDDMRAKSIQVLVFCSQAVGLVLFTFVTYAVLRWVLGSQAAAFKAMEDLVGEAKSSLDKDDNSQQQQRGLYSLVNGREFDREVARTSTPQLHDLPSSMNRSLSRRMAGSSRSSTPFADGSSKLPAPSNPTSQAHPAITPLPKVGLMLQSPLPKNLKNV